MTPTGDWINELEKQRKERGEDWYKQATREIVIADLKMLGYALLAYMCFIGVASWILN